jgi:hypothetical protein
MVSKTRLIEMVKAHDAEAVAAGLDESPGLLTWRDERGRNWLHLCCAQNVEDNAARAEASVRTAEALIARGLGIEEAAFAEGAWQATPLWFSISRGRNLKLAQRLLEMGARPAHSMHAAAFNSDLEAMRLLAAYGHPVDEYAEGETPFLFMIKWSRFATAEALLDLGADVNTWDAKGQTALHAMLKKGSDKAHFETLLRRGARGDIAGPDGQTAIDLMRRKRDPEFRRMAEALARAGDQPDAEMIAAAERVAAIIEGGAVAPPAGAFASHGVTIIENFAPFVFEGPGSIERWCEQMRAHLSGVTALRHTFGPGQDFSRRGDDVYFSLPTHWRGLKNGQPFAEDGGWAFVLTRHGDMWRVRAYGWAVTRFTTTLQS